MTAAGLLTRLLRTLARLYPWPVDCSAALDRSLGFLDVDIGPETVVRGGYGAALAAAPVVALAVALAGPSLRLPVGLAGIGLLLALVHGVHAAPRLAATTRRTRALGDAPALVGRVVLRMRVTPAVERAVAFAAETGRGPLAASLADHARRARGRPDAGLGRFGGEWAEWFPALRRSLLLVASADTASPAERERTLDRALTVALGGARDRMVSFANGLQGPSTAIYAFGVLLPLALVALLPAVRATGVSVPLPAVVVVYDLLLPATLLGAGAWVLARRPVAFPPPAVDRSHPEASTRPWLPVVVGTAAGAVAWAVSALVVADWLGPLSGVGVGLGAGLVVAYRPVRAVRNRVRAVEEGLTDALYYVGRRVEEGEAVERAIADAADEVPAATGAVLEDAARRQRQLRVGVREAFLGVHGALADVPSRRARSAALLLSLAAREGRPAGGAVVAMADTLDSLAAVERDARQEMATVTRTLSNTATVFGPLVAGATVALSESVAAAGTLAASGLPTAALGVAVGGYVLVLAVVLTVLSTGLKHGLDRALVGYRAGVALCAATVTYAASYAGVALFV